MSAGDDEYEEEFKRKNNFRANTEAKVCCNCANYMGVADYTVCLAARHDIKGGKYFRDMWVEPGDTCDKFDRELQC